MLRISSEQYFLKQLFAAIVLVLILAMCSVSLLVPYYSAFNIRMDLNFMLSFLRSYQFYLLLGYELVMVFLASFFVQHVTNKLRVPKNNLQLFFNDTVKNLLLAAIVVFGLMLLCGVLDDSLSVLVKREYIGFFGIVSFVLIFSLLIFLGLQYKWNEKNVRIVKYFIVANLITIAYLHYMFKQHDPAHYLDPGLSIIITHLIWFIPVVALLISGLFNKLTSDHKSLEIPQLYYIVTGGILTNFTIIFITNNVFTVGSLKSIFTMALFWCIASFIIWLPYNKYKTHSA